jgi:hypothetical protein
MGSLSTHTVAAARLGVTSMLCLALMAIAKAAEPLEYAVKAAYLAKFPFYVDWPPAAFPAPGSPLNLCVVGDDPFGSVLDEAVAGQQVQGHAVTVRRIKAAARDPACHIAYLASDVRIENWRGSGALVVTDGANTAGMISFVVKDSRVRFIVDDEAAAEAGLAISSKLLSVALAVKPRVQR